MFQDLGDESRLQRKALVLRYSLIWLSVANMQVDQIPELNYNALEFRLL